MTKRTQTTLSPTRRRAPAAPEAPRWIFDADVAACYADMLARSIPHYGVMRESVTALARHFAQPHTAVLDLGCATGGALEPIIARLGATCTYLGVDSSEPMLHAARHHLADPIARGICTITDCDLRHAYPDVHASVTLAILTLQFIPLDYRQRLVQRMYAHTLPGGACIIVEKVLGSSATIDDLMVENYYALKSANNYSSEDIQQKRAALEGVLVPLTARWNEDLLRTAGFDQIDCFWRWMNFTGWVAIKDV
jgi:tRNA (cmo5U34)-methyltransferase